ncbi:Abi-like protein [Pseudoleptotrichia goodfellowii F0264]|uniref:Abi-like protein n=1 Tax=Pseudoleptotrichia goodfellowii F0264 TaxID=596323 RepID=D0GPV0_9FUSO|nr:Abi family protein [Pseudoleptotrichia goodfellowii]EEY33868.1 Abi-like protein [Pseudoleptotrichia goodfellowii F0264]
MSKPFKTYRQQLSILRNRGMEIKDGGKVIKILKRENYYSIINGYKDIFIDNNSTIEKFKMGTTFEDIYCIFEFDRNLRNIFLKNILKIESLVNTKISYYFSERNQKEFSYLNINNFHPSKLEENTGLIANISNVIKDKSKSNKSNQISHHLKNHQDLPLWILIKQFTFGITAFFILLLQMILRIKFQAKYQVNIPMNIRT